MKARKSECRKAIDGEFLLADVAVALGVAHVKVLGELESLLDVCPALAGEVEPVTAHPSRGGHWEETYSMTAAALFALLGFIGIRDRTKLVQYVFAHPHKPIEEIQAAQKADLKEGE